jgi:hypothetical protein
VTAHPFISVCFFCTSDNRVALEMLRFLNRHD